MKFIVPSRVLSTRGVMADLHYMGLGMMYLSTELYIDTCNRRGYWVA